MTLPEIEKHLSTQEVRIFDMFALGPFMMWYALKSGGKKGMGAWPRRALFVSGAMTVIYNWSNYKNMGTILTAKYAKMEKTSEKVAGVLSRQNFLNQG